MPALLGNRLQRARAICEVLVANEPIRAKVQSRANAAEIGEVARRDGMRLLRDDGVEKVVSGITTPKEIARVTAKTRHDYDGRHTRY